MELSVSELSTSVRVCGMLEVQQPAVLQQLGVTAYSRRSSSCCCSYDSVPEGFVYVGWVEHEQLCSTL